MNLRLILYMLAVLVYGIMLFFFLHSKKRVYFLLGCLGVVFFAMIIIDAWGIFDTELFSFSADVWQATKYDFFGWGALFLIFLFVNAASKDAQDEKKKEAVDSEPEDYKIINITVTIEKNGNPADHD